MKLIERVIQYNRTEDTFESASVNYREVRLCADELCAFFDLPDKIALRAEKKKYIISLHTTEVPNSLEIRFKHANDIMIQNRGAWMCYVFYWGTKDIIRDMSNKAKTTTLYVVLEEK